MEMSKLALQSKIHSINFSGKIIGDNIMWVALNNYLMELVNVQYGVKC